MILLLPATIEIFMTLHYYSSIHSFKDKLKLSSVKYCLFYVLGALTKNSNFAGFFPSFLQDL